MDGLLNDYQNLKNQISKLSKETEQDMKPLRKEFKVRSAALKDLMESKGASIIKVSETKYARLRPTKSRRAVTLQNIEAALMSIVPAGSRSRVVDTIADLINQQRIREYNVVKIEDKIPRNPLFIKRADEQTTTLVHDLEQISCKLQVLKSNLKPLQQDFRKAQENLQKSIISGGKSQETIQGSNLKLRKSFGGVASVSQIQDAVRNCIPEKLTTESFKNYLKMPELLSALASEIFVKLNASTKRYKLQVLNEN